MAEYEELFAKKGRMGVTFSLYVLNNRLLTAGIPEPVSRNVDDVLANLKQHVSVELVGEWRSETFRAVLILVDGNRLVYLGHTGPVVHEFQVGSKKDRTVLAAFEKASKLQRALELV